METLTNKIDFKKSFDSYQASKDTFRIVDVPTLQYVMIDGHGDPNTPTAYTAAIEALYPVAYKTKFISKRELGRDYVVPPLEGLWWAAYMAAFTTARDKTQWHWTLMILVPEWIDRAVFEAAVSQTGAKNPPARLSDIRLESLSGRLCVQILHIGAYDDEGPVLEQLHSSFIPEHGLELTGKHHEVYFSDPEESRQKNFAPYCANQSDMCAESSHDTQAFPRSFIFVYELSVRRASGRFRTVEPSSSRCE